MVKDDKHRTRAIALTGGEIAISSHRRAFTLVSSIQEEVHRYAIGYHRQQRKKTAVSSTLTSIPGIGETRAKALMKHFKTVTAISEAGRRAGDDQACCPPSVGAFPSGSGAARRKFWGNSAK